jgi:hypothetical protein
MKAQEPARYAIELEQARERQRARRAADPERVREQDRDRYWRRKLNGAGDVAGATAEDIGRRIGTSAAGVERLLSDEARRGHVWRDRDGVWRINPAGFAPDLLHALAHLAPTDRDHSRPAARRVNGHRPIRRGLPAHERRVLEQPTTNGVPPGGHP